MVREVSPLKSQWFISSWQSLLLCWWSELERLERVSLLFNENRDENKTSGFLNRHIYGTTMIQYQLKKKHTRLNKVLVGSEVFTGVILEPQWLVSSWPSRVLSWLYKFWFFKFLTRILTWRNTERSHNLHFSRSISRINPVANSVLVPFDFAYETLKNYPMFWL